MTENLKKKWVYGICIAFIAINTVFIINEIYWFSIFPFAIIVLLILFYKPDLYLLLLTFLTPLSIKLVDRDINSGLSLPTEPLFFGLMILFVVRTFYHQDYPRKAGRHIVSFAVIIYFLWMVFTTITSTIPVVSIKFLLSKLWFVIPLYFFGILVFRNIKRIRQFVWMYTLALSIVAVYTTYKHSFYNFDEKVGNWIMTPFYNDHTAYGAALAMVIPFILGFSVDKTRSHTIRFYSSVILIILVFAMILSTSRAAWVSVAGALAVFAILRLKINYRYVLAVCVGIVSVMLIYRTEIINQLEKNKQDSSSNYVAHIKSISNISTDASNLERINRWQSALRMFIERPVLGFGPGTYQFMYAPYQYSKEKTIISTNSGDMGNAHSEYIGPLAEQGFIGTLSFIFIVASISYTTVRVYKRNKSKEIKNLSICAFLGLVTYFIHGLLNNFLDTDKLSVPFWGFAAIIVALDVFYNEEKQEQAAEFLVNDKF